MRNTWVSVSSPEGFALVTQPLVAESVVREIQKIKRSVIFLFFFYLLLVASLRFSLVYLCVHFVFSTAALHFLVRWISRLIALWSKGARIPSLHLFVRKTLNLDQFFLVHWQMKTSFSIMIMGSYKSENNCSCQWRCESTGKLQH